MIIDFTIENFRSIKERQIFSFEAGPGIKNTENLFDVQNYNLKLLKTSVIYGANASGKTNIIKTLHSFRYLIISSSKLKTGDPIRAYDPFLFDDKYNEQPTVFYLHFIGSDDIKYEYGFSFTRNEIIHEELKYFPQNYPAILFTRQSNGEVKLGKSFENKKGVPRNVLRNRLFLSEVGGNLSHKHMNSIYLYFKEKFQIWNLNENYSIQHLEKRLTRILVTDQNSQLIKKMNDLFRVMDMKIEKILVTKRGGRDPKVLESLPEEFRNEVAENYKYRVEMVHNYQNKAGEIVTKNIDLNDESNGVKVLYALGGLILEKFQTGGIIIIDELETSLHPKLCRFLISLFYNEKLNTGNAQLIFTSNHPELLSDGLFRKDQVWIAKKSKFGETEFYSMGDFDNVRDNVPLDKWYMAGKFEGLPKIKQIEFISLYTENPAKN